jgi:hypothetical protein
MLLRSFDLSTLSSACGVVSVLAYVVAHLVLGIGSSDLGAMLVAVGGATVGIVTYHTVSPSPT